VELFLQQVLNGLTLGGVYSLVALGLTLVYGILHVPNFAHGRVLHGGRVSCLPPDDAFGLNYWLAMAGAAVVVAVIAMLAERLVFHPLRNAEGLHDMIAAIGILLFLEAGAQAMFGADFHRMQTPYGRHPRSGGVTLPVQRLLIIAPPSG
jgi:branched-chain amino acid transport system permease protein